MIFISQLACTAVSADKLEEHHMLKSVNLFAAGAACINMNIGAYDSDWYTEHNCTNLVTIWQIFML